MCYADGCRHAAFVLQLQVVIAHELGHLKCEHGVWVAAANAVALGLYNLGGFVGQMLSRQLQGLLLAWQRAAELSCDRAALLVAQVRPEGGAARCCCQACTLTLPLAPHGTWTWCCPRS
jgi:hypothetical protein